MKIDIATQSQMKEQILLHLNAAMDELKKSLFPCRRLRTCTAWVYETEHYYILKSYDTFVACIHKESDTLFDALRIVYDFTTTSCQYIRKFAVDYGIASYGTMRKMIGRMI